MTRVGLVALGGAIGSVARYGVGALAAQLLGPAFPWGTLLVNLSGSFLIALVMHVALSGSAAPAGNLSRRRLYRRQYTIERPPAATHTANVPSLQLILRVRPRCG